MRSFGIVLAVVTAAVAFGIMRNAAECAARGGKRLPDGTCIAKEALR